MEFKLYRVETYGMKNIDKKIRVDFQNQMGSTNKKKEITNIKAIYGTNGAGKTAFILSMNLYKKLITDHMYLFQEEVISELNNFINKKIKKFYIGIVFSATEINSDNEPVEKIFKHEITLNYDEQYFHIQNEKFSILNDQSINGKFNVIFESSPNEISFNERYKSEGSEYARKATNNILKYSSFSSFFSRKDFALQYADILSKNSENDIVPEKYIYLFLPFAFANNLTIYLAQEDKYNPNNNKSFEEIIKNLHLMKDVLESKISSDEDLVIKSDIHLYEKKILKLTKFIKIFKPGLIKINIEKKEDQKYYHCKKIMVYKDFCIDSSFESTGIKKIMSLFNSIEAVTINKIVFIDELDSNISAVYLNKLLEYLQVNNKGQLCFTSHNLYPMNYLYKFTYSIDFLGETGKLVSWKKNGNYKPYNQYPEGMIEDSPFNVDYFDFIKVFESEGE